MKIQHSLSLFGLTFASVIVPPLVHAQPIIPANDGTGTQIVPNNHQWNIQGGQRSSDGSNLFHSFQNFNVNTGQIGHALSLEITPNLTANPVFKLSPLLGSIYLSRKSLVTEKMEYHPL